MREELDTEITSQEDNIKAVMGDEEHLTAVAYKVCWKTFTSSRFDTTALKEELPDIIAHYIKQNTARIIAQMEQGIMSSASLKMAGVFSEPESKMIRARVKSGTAKSHCKETEGWPTSDHRGGYPNDIHEALSGVCR